MDRWPGDAYELVPSDIPTTAPTPSYGIDSDYEGERALSEIGACHVYRVDPQDGTCRVVADGFERPNGLAFSADERRLFISDTRRNHIRAFEVSDEWRRSVRELLRWPLRRVPVRRAP